MKNCSVSLCGLNTSEIMRIKVTGVSTKINKLIHDVERSVGFGYCTVEYPEQYKFCTGSFNTCVCINVSIPIDIELFSKREYAGLQIKLVTTKSFWEKPAKTTHGNWYRRVV